MHTQIVIPHFPQVNALDVVSLCKSKSMLQVSCQVAILTAFYLDPGIYGFLQFISSFIVFFMQFDTLTKITRTASDTSQTTIFPLLSLFTAWIGLQWFLTQIFSLLSFSIFDLQWFSIPIIFLLCSSIIGLVCSGSPFRSFLCSAFLSLDWFVAILQSYLCIPFQFFELACSNFPF